jgi:hypothetical protein
MALGDGGYLFWPQGGDGLTYDQLLQRRAIAQALATRQKGFPKNKGEGLTYLGESFAEGMQMLALARAEQAQRARDKEAASRRSLPESGAPPPEYKPVPRADVPIEPTKPTQQVSSVDVTTPEPMPVDIPLPTPRPDIPVDVGAVGGSEVSSGLGDIADVASDSLAPASQPTQTADISGPPPPETQLQDQANEAMLALQQGREPAVQPPVAQPAAPLAPLASTAPANDAASRETIFGQQPGRDRIAQLLTPVAGPSGATSIAGPGAGEPIPAPDVPLPRGNPRTTGGVQATMDTVFSRAGFRPPAIEGLKRNAYDESRFNYTERHPDQPRFTGEARMSHGLFQEGGDEWLNMVKWMEQKYPGYDWRDPKIQSEYVAERLQDTSRPDYNRTFAKMNATDSSGVAADAFLRGYLKPADQYLQQRSAAYLGGRGSDFGSTQIADRSAGGGAEGTVMGAGGRVGGAPQPETRDLVAQALLQQEKPQAPLAAPEDGQDERLRDVVGMTNRGILAQRPTASLGRAGVASDALSPVAPMGRLDGAEPPPPAAIGTPAIDRPPLAVSPAQSPTVTDIAPAPPIGAPGAQLAQVGAAPAVPPRPPSPADTVAPGPTQYPDIGPQPTPPRPRAYGPEARRAFEDANNPDLSPQARAQAKAEFEVWHEKKQREELFDKEVYGAQLKQWYDQFNKRREFELGGTKRQLEEAQQRETLRAAEQTRRQGEIAQPAVPAGGAGGLDPTLNTPQSPQRTGIPNTTPVPIGVDPNTWKAKMAEDASKSIEAARSAVPQLQRMIDTFVTMRNHPGAADAIGPAGMVARNVPGSNAYAFNQLWEQTRGQRFLQGYQSLKGGGGAISNIEGSKTEQSIAAMDPNQDPKNYWARAAEAENNVRSDLERVQRNMNQPVTAWQKKPSDPPAPDIGTLGTRNGRMVRYKGGNPALDSSYEAQ